MNLYHTRQPPDEAVYGLVQHPRLLIRHSYECDRPLRFHPKRLNPAGHQHQVFYQKRLADFSEMQRWYANGGILIYEKPIWRHDKMPLHTAQLMCELPTTTHKYTTATLRTAGECVVFVPASWDQHLLLVGRRNPSAKQVWSVLLLISRGARSDDLCRSLGIPPGTIVSDQAAATTLETDRKQFWHLRKSILHKRLYHRLQPLYPRIRPQTKEKGLVELYDFLEQLPVHNGARILVDSAPSIAMRGWRHNLMVLANRGNIGLEPLMAVYHLDSYKPDFDRIEAQRKRAVDDFKSLVAMVLDSPELPPTRTLSPAPESPLSEEPSSDTPRSDPEEPTLCQNQDSLEPLIPQDEPQPEA